MARKETRKSMAGLLDNRLASKSAEPAKGTRPRVPTVTRAGEPPIRERPNARDRDYRTIMARINFGGWQALRNLSADLDRPVEDMIIGSLNDLLTAHGRGAPIMKSRRPGTVKGEA